MFDLTRNQRDHTCRKRTCLLPSVAYVMFHLKGWSCRENEVSEGSERCHSDRKAIWRGTLGHPEQRTLWKRCITVRPTVALYLDELLIQKCKFGIQFSRHWPQLGLPQLAPMAPCRSHHRNHTRQEWIIIWSGRNWILKHAKRQETNLLDCLFIGVLGLAPCHVHINHRSHWHINQQQ